MLNDKDFDNHFKATRRLAVIWGFISMAVSLSILGFIGWVIIKLMAYFGVI
jgi:hypothetical protein